MADPTPVVPKKTPWIQYAAKAATALFAGAVAVVGSLVVAVTGSSDAGTAISTAEWLQATVVALSAIGGSLGVYAVKNTLRKDTGW